MRAFKTNHFARYAGTQRITDAELWDAFGRIDGSNLDSNLGSGLIKQRFARPGRRGRPLGYCSILAYRTDNRALFFYGFPRNRPDELAPRELAVYRRLAAVILQLNEESIKHLIAEGKFTEVQHGKEISQ